MKRTVGKTSTVAIYQPGSGRWLVTWYDEHGLRRSASRGTLAEAKSIQKQKAENWSDISKAGLRRNRHSEVEQANARARLFTYQISQRFS
jgi:hypothetical protein